MLGCGHLVRYAHVYTFCRLLFGVLDMLDTVLDCIFICSDPVKGVRAVLDIGGFLAIGTGAFVFGAKPYCKILVTVIRVILFC